MTATTDSMDQANDEPDIVDAEIEVPMDPIPVIRLLPSDELLMFIDHEVPRLARERNEEYWSKKLGHTVHIVDGGRTLAVLRKVAPPAG